MWYLDQLENATNIGVLVISDLILYIYNVMGRSVFLKCWDLKFTIIVVGGVLFMSL